MRYTFETHYGHCSLTDTETGIVIEWKARDYNNTSKVTHDAATIAKKIPEGEHPALFLARIMREMGDYIVANYSEYA